MLRDDVAVAAASGRAEGAMLRDDVAITAACGRAERTMLRNLSVRLQTAIGD